MADNINLSLEELKTALAGLADALCCPNVVIEPGGINFADEPEPIGGIEFGEPPTGWGEFAAEGGPEYYTRKCTMANAIVDATEAFFQWLIDNVYPQFESTTLAVIMGLVALGLSLPSVGPFAVIIGVATGIGTLVTLMLSGGWDPIVLRDIAANNKPDLVCALFLASDADEAKADYLAIFTAQGANAKEVQVLNILLSASGAMNNLFFASSYVPDPEPGLTSCDDCEAAPCGNVIAYSGYGEILSDTGEVISAHSLFTDTFWRVSIAFNYNPPSYCDAPVTITNAQLTIGSLTSGSVPIHRVNSPGASGGDLYNGNSFPSFPIAGVGVYSFTSTTEFTIEVTYA